MDIRARALEALRLSSPEQKVQSVAELHAQWHAGRVPLDAQAHHGPPADLPGRPQRPRLVLPRDLPPRRTGSADGHAALIHSVAHIEFNAINLALDAVWRFPGLPRAYYADWLQVAREEAHHYSLLQAHLVSLGHTYGDFDAHDGLWTMTERTAADPLARMALVPRLLEARGLDATPPMQRRLRSAGDHQAVAILDIILRDEIGHVAVGNRWFRHLCHMRGLDPLTTFRALAREHGAPRLKPPFNLEARMQAGFVEAELATLGDDPLASPLTPAPAPAPVSAPAPAPPPESGHESSAESRNPT